MKCFIEECEDEIVCVNVKMPTVPEHYTYLWNGDEDELEIDDKVIVPFQNENILATIIDIFPITSTEYKQLFGGNLPTACLVH